VVFNDQLLVVHQGQRQDASLWFNVFDGNEWRGDQQIDSGCITDSPSCVSVTNDDGSFVYCFHQGANQSGRLVVRRYDGEAWRTVWTDVPGTLLSCSPAAVLHDAKIIVLYQGGGRNGELWTKEYSFQQDEWGPDTRVPQAFMSGSPASMVAGNALHVAYRGGGDSEQLSLQTAIIDIYKATMTWGPPGTVANALSSQAPAMVEASFPALRQG
jgi:hypothetical protein